MLQFLRFNSSFVAKEAEYKIITGKSVIFFFLKRFMLLIMFIYSTLFLAVALPFVSTPFMPIYFCGSMATMFLLIRIVNEIIKYIRFAGGAIKVTPETVEVTDKKSIYKLPKDEITYLERNLQGNLVIREKFHSISFPLLLLEAEDRELLLSRFEDIAPKRTSFYKKVWEFVDAVVVAMVLAVHIIQYIVQAYYIPTGSMEDTLRVGDHLFVEKITLGPVIPQMLGMSSPVYLGNYGLRIREMERGDIVIFKPPHEVDKDYIKRLIALPGENFEIKQGSVYIDGRKLDEPYVKGVTTYSYFGNGYGESIEGVVPEGKVIVLGDNRQNSQDSRSFGYLEIKKIQGKSFLLYWNTGEILKDGFFKERFGLIR